MTKTVRSRYTLEFKQEAVRLVQSGQSMAAVSRGLGIVEQTLFNWVKAQREGRHKGADSKPVSAEQMEISRLRAGHSATCNAIATQQRQTGASAVVVLGGLLEDADRMAGSCAAALERSRIAGLACEAVVDGMRRTN